MKVGLFFWDSMGKRFCLSGKFVFKKSLDCGPKGRSSGSFGEVSSLSPRLGPLDHDQRAPMSQFRSFHLTHFLSVLAYTPLCLPHTRGPVISFRRNVILWSCRSSEFPTQWPTSNSQIQNPFRPYPPNYALIINSTTTKTSFLRLHPFR